MKFYFENFDPQQGEVDLMKYYNYEYTKDTNTIILVEKEEERSVANGT